MPDQRNNQESKSNPRGREALLTLALRQARAALQLREGSGSPPPANVFILPLPRRRESGGRSLYEKLGDAWEQVMQFLFPTAYEGIDPYQQQEPAEARGTARDTPISPAQMRVIDQATRSKAVVGSWSQAIRDERARGDRGMPLPTLPQR